MIALLNHPLNFWLYWFTFCGIMLGGYFISASSLYWILYSFPRKFLVQTADLQLRTETVVKDDIKRSVRSVICFALGAASFMCCYQWGLTEVYTQVPQYGIGYCFASYIAVLLLQDTYFYFLHRLLHLPKLFGWFHRGHHISKPPTPWTFFALEPFEALSQILFLLVITLVIPLHIGVLLAVLLTMAIWAMGNHLGFPIVAPSSFSAWCGRWCIGSAHHLVHHRYCNRHFGLYFTFWDKMLGTQDAGYEELYQG